MKFRKNALVKIAGFKDWIKGIRSPKPKFVIRDEATTDSVRNFFSDYILPTKLEHGGEPGKDYNQESYYDPFSAVDRRFSTPEQDVGIFAPNKSVGGYFLERTQSDPDRIVINRKYSKDKDKHPLDSINTHETLHYLQSRSPNQDNGGVSAQELEKLKKAYNFGQHELSNYPHDRINYYAPKEMHSTNGQLQFELYTELSNKLGRRATKEELHDYVKGMTPRQIYDFVNSHMVNLYLKKGLERNPLDKRQEVPSAIPRGDVDISTPEKRQAVLTSPWFIKHRAEMKTLGRMLSDMGDTTSCTTVRPGRFWLRDNERNRPLDVERLEAIRRAWLEVAKTNLRGPYAQMDQYANYA